MKISTNLKHLKIVNNANKTKIKNLDILKNQFKIIQTSKTYSKWHFFTYLFLAFVNHFLNFTYACKNTYERPISIQTISKQKNITNINKIPHLFQV